MADSAFPAMAFSSLGYESAHHGNGRWNGVAILSKVGLTEVTAAFEGEDSSSVEECRILTASCGGVRVSSVYVPNGRSVGSEFYEAKLAWLSRLEEHLRATSRPDEKVAVCGDFNVAPDDRDVWDPAAFEGATHVSQPERDALARLEKWGLVDSFRQIYDEEGLFSWWDYRKGDFHQHRGTRIDLVMATRPLADHARYALIDRFARKGKQPSDHAPVLVDFDVDSVSG